MQNHAVGKDTIKEAKHPTMFCSVQCITNKTLIVVNYGGGS